MGKINNLIGKKFGRLKVVALSHVSRRAYWNCECDCGNKIVMVGKELVTGNTKSCGCYRMDRPKLEASRDKSNNWKGNSVQYRALHQRFYGIIKGRNVCLFCSKKCKTELANKSGKYKKTISDWMWLCKECHSRYDNGWKKKNGGWIKKCSVCKKNKEVNTKNFYLRKNNRWVSKCIKCHKAGVLAAL